MKIIIAGGTGFIGTELIRQISGNHQLIVLTRNPGTKAQSGSVEFVEWDGTPDGSWTRHVDGADAVINFAGVTIAGKRWTKTQKKKILGSRINATKAIVEAVGNAKNKPSVLVNISAVGYYGNIEEGDVTEQHSSGDDFLAYVCRQWEQEALVAEKRGVRVVLPRLGVVLGKNGGALQKLLLPFRMFVGGPLGSGKQWFPWIHIDDVIGIIMYAIENKNVSGPINAATPEAVRMKEFCATLGKVLHRPSWAPVPAFALKLILGEMAMMLLTGQKVIPQKILNAGYQFKHPRLSEALQSIV